MSAFSALPIDTSRKPATVVSFPPSGWAVTHGDRPTAPVEIGLRVLSEAERIEITSLAATKACRLHPADHDEDGRVHAYNRLLMALAVARAACHVDDATVPYWPSGVADDLVPNALTSEGIDHIYHALDRAMVEQNPAQPEADETDLSRLADLMTMPDAFVPFTPAFAQRLRRLLRYCLDHLDG